VPLYTTPRDTILGNPTISGKVPVRYVSPVDEVHAHALVVGVRQRYFDFAKHEHVKALVKSFFEDGYPFEPHISGVMSDLSDMKTIRNACAHMSSTTRAALIALETRILGVPSATADVHGLLTAVDPRSGPGSTVLSGFRAKLLVAAQGVANG
jgi:hypothetical protein